MAMKGISCASSNAVVWRLYCGIRVGSFVEYVIHSEINLTVRVSFAEYVIQGHEKFFVVSHVRLKNAW